LLGSSNRVGTGWIKKILFFVAPAAGIFAGSWEIRFDRPARLDTAPGGSVQNILKKVKKRLVSPLKPR